MDKFKNQSILTINMNLIYYVTRKYIDLKLKKNKRS